MYFQGGAEIYMCDCMSKMLCVSDILRVSCFFGLMLLVEKHKTRKEKIEWCELARKQLKK
jgi:hypothetical protein